MLKNYVEIDLRSIYSFDSIDNLNQIKLSLEEIQTASQKSGQNSINNITEETDNAP